MKTTVSTALKGKPVMGTFMTYVFSTKAHKGKIMEVDFKVRGKQIEYKYTELKKSH